MQRLLYRWLAQLQVPPNRDTHQAGFIRYPSPGSVCVVIQDCCFLHLLCLPWYPAWTSFMVAAVPSHPAPAALLLVMCALVRGYRVACPKMEQGGYACPLQCPCHLSQWPRWSCG